MSRLTQRLEGLQAQNEKAMGLFITAGFPNPEDTNGILHALDRAGVDFIELGMPFSDPLAEGRPIQRSSAQALSHGVSISDTLRTAETFRAASETPLLLMGYVNPVLQYGTRDFCRDASAAGVDGFVLPDLPPEEGEDLRDAAAEENLDVIFLIAPNSSNDRIEFVDRRATGFVYAVSVTGLTGSDLAETPSVDEYLERARQRVTQNPLLVGFGIKTHEDAMRLCRHTDGFIVGSALINHVESVWDDASLSPSGKLESVERFARELKYGQEKRPA